MQKLRTLFITTSCFFALASCQQAPLESLPSADEPDRIEVRRSPNDDRTYRWLTLENKLRVLLVSDASTDKSAAALAVYRGSFHEPADKSGLAHFLEHMLFIQTETYPEIDGFQTFVSANGGSSNAYTAADHTNYFFDVRPEAFPEALDRWGHFFIDPVISAEYADREKNAVHSEYQMQIKADNWRGFMASKQTLNPQHPGSRFTIGSLDTLAGDIQSDLLKFFDQAYSADQMGLVVLSNQGLEELERLIRPIFSQIENKNLGPKPITIPMFTPDQLPAQLHYVSQKQGATVSYGFPLPSTRPYYRTKPEQYFANLIGHEGQGSLYQALSQQGWIESLSSGVSAFDDATSLLSVSIQLTPSGVGALESIHDYVFKYLDTLRAAEPQQWLYDEQATVSELGFRFQEKSRPTGFVYQMAPRLQHYPAEDLLVAPYLMEAFDADVIKDYLQYLTPANVLVEFSSPDVETNEVEPWFNVPYRIESGTVSRQATAATFSLPPVNEFLPSDLSLKAADDSTIERASTDPGLRIWSDRDVRYGAPRANLNLEIIIPGGLVDPAERGMAQLYRRMVQDSLSELTYPAYLAGLGYGISVTDAGFEVSVSGYQDKQQVLLSAVLNALISAELSQDRFDFLKAALIKDWQNMTRERPYTQVMSAMQDILRSGRWPRDTLIEAMDPVTLGDLQAFQTRLFREVAITALLNGNIDATDTSGLSELLKTTFSLAEHTAHRPQAGSVSEALLHEVAIDHNDAAVVIHIQDPSDSFDDRATSMLAAQILRPEYFRELRTEQQLGYVVSASNQSVVKRAGISFIVQSPAQGAAYLEQATVEFMDGFVEFFKAMPEAEFAQHKAGVITRLLEEPKNLGERSALYWRDILDDHLTFDSRQMMATVVEQRTKSELEAYFQSVREGLSGSRLMVYNTGRFGEHPARGRALAHPSDFAE